MKIPIATYGAEDCGAFIGVVTADGQPVELDHLDEMLQAVKTSGGAVWYYREPAADPESGMNVVKLVIKHQLPIRLSTKPDYSDEVDGKGQARAAGNLPRMPEVAVRDNIEQVFAAVRRTAAGDKGTRGMVIVAPDRRMLLLPALESSDKLNQMAAGMERLIPSAVKRNIAVIACTDIPAATQTAYDVAAANRTIPFLGLLTALTYLGHSVWIFEGHASALAAGCRDADVLFVDSGMLPHLPQGWGETAGAAMRNANILLHDRNSFKLRFLKKAGDSHDRLEFPQ